jgi:hypothetical protein
VKWATLLLESGCDPLAITQDFVKTPPLHIAAIAHPEVASVFLKQKTVDINSKSPRMGDTARRRSYAHARMATKRCQTAPSREDVQVNAKHHGVKTALMWAYQKLKATKVLSNCHLLGEMFTSM